jgi:hypothetical protein
MLVGYIIDHVHICFHNLEICFFNEGTIGAEPKTLFRFCLIYVDSAHILDTYMYFLFSYSFGVLKVIFIFFIISVDLKEFFLWKRPFQCVHSAPLHLFFPQNGVYPGLCLRKDAYSFLISLLQSTTFTSSPSQGSQTVDEPRSNRHMYIFWCPVIFLEMWRAYTPTSKFIWLMHTASYTTPIWMHAWNVFHSTVRFWNLSGWSFFSNRIYVRHVGSHVSFLDMCACHLARSPSPATEIIRISTRALIYVPHRLIISTAICDRNRSTVRTDASLQQRIAMPTAQSRRVRPKLPSA